MVTKQHFLSSLMIFLFSALLSGCLPMTEEIQAKWHDPQYTKGPVKGLLVILISDNSLQKRSFEDTLSQYMRSRGITTEVGYKIIPVDTEINEQFVQSCIVGIDADAILVTRIMGTEIEKQTIPGYSVSGGNFGSNFSSYYARSYQTRAYHVPSTTVEVEQVYFDSRLYQCESENLLWQMQIKSMQTRPFNKMIERIAPILYKNLDKNHFL